MKQQNIAEKQTVTMNNHYAQLIKQTGISKTGTPYHMSSLPLSFCVSVVCDNG
jgi:hypothetical protein